MVRLATVKQRQGVEGRLGSAAQKQLEFHHGNSEVELCHHAEVEVEGAENLPVSWCFPGGGR
jgi:hypothetical protein